MRWLERMSADTTNLYSTLQIRSLLRLPARVSPSPTTAASPSQSFAITPRTLTGLRPTSATSAYTAVSTAMCIWSMHRPSRLKQSILRPPMLPALLQPYASRPASITHRNSPATLEAKLFDANGVLCLDARNAVRFSLAGVGRLIDNLGTSTGSRLVEMYNGRARISIERNGGASTVSVVSAGIAPAFVSIS